MAPRKRTGQKVKLPMLTLSSDLQLLILSKMNNDEMIKLPATCTEIKNFVESHRKLLSSRTVYGDPYYLVALQGEVYFYRWDRSDTHHAVIHKSRFAVDLDMPERENLLSIIQLDIEVIDPSAIPKAVEFLKKFQTVCGYAGISGNPPVEAIDELTENLKCLTPIGIRIEKDVIETVSALKQAKNAYKFDAVVINEWLTSNDIFAYFRHFGQFEMTTTPQAMVGFFWALFNFNDNVNIRECTFRLHIREDEAIFPYISSAPFPETVVLFSEAKEKSVVKLNLPHVRNKCAMIYEVSGVKNDDQIKKNVTVAIMNNNDAMILNFILEKLFKDKNHLSKEERQRYLEMNQEERIKEIQAIVNGNEPISAPAAKKAKLDN